MPTRILGARRGVTKPKPWRITPRRVAPEGQWAWGPHVLGRWPLWEGAGTDTVDLAGGNTGVWRGTPTWTPTKRGISADIDGVTDRDVRVDGFTPSLTTDFALEAFWVHRDGIDGDPTDENDGILSKRDSDTANKDFWFGIVSGDGGSMRWGTEGGNIQTNRTTWPAGQPFHTVINHFDSTRSQIWVNGELDVDASPGDSVSDNSDRLNFGSLVDITFLRGKILLVAVYGRTLTGGEISHLARDPFAPFRPQRVAWVGGPTADGVQTITAAWSESVGPDDTQDPQATLRPELSEAVGATDVFAAAATLVGAWDETAGPRETYEVAKTVTATLDETVGPTDTQGDVVATLAASISEGLDAGETWAATLMATAAYSETVGPTDTFELPETVVSAAWSEGTDASDTFLATLAAVANLQEIVGASETIEVDATLVAEYLETVGPTDLWEATATLGAAVTETAGPTDSFQLPADAAAKLTALIQTAARVAGQLQSQPKVDADDGTRPGVDGTPETSA